MSNIVVMNKAYSDEKALESVITYCAGLTVKHEKCIGYKVYGAINFSVEHIVMDFNHVKEVWGKTEGRQLCHIVETIDVPHNKNNFGNYGMSRDKQIKYAEKTSLELGKLIWNAGYQNCFFVHNDTDHVHVHYVINTVNMFTGRKIHNLGDIGYMMHNYVAKNYKELVWKGVYFRNSKGDLFDEEIEYN